MSLHFIRPEFAFLFLPLFFFAWRYIREKHQKTRWRYECDAHLLPALLKEGNVKRQKWFERYVFSFFLLGVVAAMGPSWHKEEVEVFRLPHATVFAVDLSQNMQTKDVLNESRLLWSQMKLRGLIERMQESLMSLVVFSNDAYVLSPMTEDGRIIESMVSELSPDVMPIDGANINSALDKTVEVFQNSDVSRGDVVLIASSEPSSLALSKAKQLQKKGFRVSVLEVTGASNETSLIRLAEEGKGFYQKVAADNHDIDSLAEMILPKKGKERIGSENTITVWRDEGHYLIWLMLVIAALFFSKRFIYRLIS